jgi:hypothetical protein
MKERNKRFTEARAGEKKEVSRESTADTEKKRSGTTKD